MNGGISTYGYVLANPVALSDRSGLVSAVEEANAFGEFDPHYVPGVSKEVKAYICEKLKAADFALDVAHLAAYHQRKQEHWMNQVHENGENWLFAARPVQWWDAFEQWEVSIVLYQDLKAIFPITATPYSLSALEAGLDGRLHHRQSKADLRKWCDSCELH